MLISCSQVVRLFGVVQVQKKKPWCAVVSVQIHIRPPDVSYARLFVFFDTDCALHVLKQLPETFTARKGTQDFARKSSPKTMRPAHHPTIFLLFCFRFSVILISFSHLFSNIFCTHFRLFVFAFFFLLKPVWDFGHNAQHEIGGYSPDVTSPLSKRQFL